MASHKKPKNSDTKTFAVIILKLNLFFYHKAVCPKDAGGMANSVDSDQTAPIWVFTVCLDLSVQKLTVIFF